MIRLLRNNLLPRRYDLGLNDTGHVHILISTLISYYDVTSETPNNVVCLLYNYLLFLFLYKTPTFTLI